MISKKLLIGPPYNGFPQSEEEARLLIQTYVASNLFCPSQQLDYKRLVEFVRSGHVLVYEENVNGLEFWSDNEDLTLIAIEQCCRISQDPAVPIPLMRKEFSMMIGGTHYGLIATWTEKDHVENSLKRGLGVKHKTNPELKAKRGRGPWEIIRLSAKGTGGTSEIVESDPEVSADPWENIHSPAQYDGCESELDELKVELRKLMVFDILHIRRQRYLGFQLVVAQSCVPELQEALGDRYHIQRRVDPRTPDAGEVNIFGLLAASENACCRLITTAVDEIRNGWSEAGQFYLCEAKSRGLGTRLEMALQSDDYDQNVLHEDEECISDNDGCLTIKY